MKFTNKEKRFKQIVEEVNHQIDTDLLWNQVEGHLDKDKRRKWFLWLLPVGMILIFSIGYFTLTDTNSILVDQSESISELTIEKSTITKEQKTSNSINESIVSNRQNASSNNTNQTIFRNENNSNDKVNITPTTSLQTFQFSNTSNSFKNQQTLSRSTKNLSQEINATTNDLVKKDLLKNTFNNALLAIEEEDSRMSMDVFSSLPSLQARSFENRMKKSADASVGNNANIEVVASKMRRLYLLMSAGSHKNMTAFTIQSQAEYAPLHAKETNLPGVSASLSLGYKLNSKWSVFTGFDYAKLITRFENIALEENQGMLTIEDQENINTQNQAYTSGGTVSTFELIANDIIWHREHNSVDIELGIEREFFPRSRFNVSPRASITQNLFTTHKGYFFTENTSIITKFEGGTQHPYRNNTGFSTKLGLRMSYSFNGLDLGVLGTYNRPFNNLTQANNNYQINNSQLSLQACVRYVLNWEN